MPNLSLFGQYECKVDAKGRLRLPKDLLDQFPEGQARKFVLNRGLDGFVSLYPYQVWLKTSEKVNRLNQYKSKNREFKRFFFRGALEVELDANDRILIPRRLTEFVGLEKDATILSYGENIEIWASERFDDKVNREPENFSDMAEDILGGDIEDME